MDSLYKLGSGFAVAVLSLFTVPAVAHGQEQPGASPRAPITFSAAAKIEMGEWPLHRADAGAVEAMFRREIARVQARFGDELDFACLGYSYGEPTAEFMEQLSDISVPLKGRLACSPRENPEYMSVLVGLSTIRCERLVCTANSDISFGTTIERGVPISAYKTPDNWSVRLNETNDD